jgi:hypothetical protein
MFLLIEERALNFKGVFNYDVYTASTWFGPVVANCLVL